MGGWWPLSHGFFCITSVIWAVVNPGDTSGQSLRRINLVLDVTGHRAADPVSEFVTESEGGAGFEFDGLDGQWRRIG